MLNLINNYQNLTFSIYRIPLLGTAIVYNNYQKTLVN